MGSAGTTCIVASKLPMSLEMKTPGETDAP